LFLLTFFQLCNKVNALEGSFEIISATALFYLGKGYPSIQKGVSLIFKGCVQKVVQKASFPDLCHTLSLFISGGILTLAMTGGV